MGILFNAEKGSKCQGEFRNGFKNGKIHLVMKDNVAYGDVIYRDDVLVSGIVNYTKSGNTFEGSFKNNQMFQGTYTHKVNGTTYTGQFKDQLYHGQGKLEGASFFYIGQFAKGKYHGVGEFKKNGKPVSFEYVGAFVNGKAEGQGNKKVFKEDDSYIFYKGEFKADQVNGKASAYFSKNE